MHDFLIAATASRDTAVQTARVGLAIGSSVFLVKTGMDYLNAIDSQVASRKWNETPNNSHDYSRLLLILY